jgi:hypothetical protein
VTAQGEIRCPACRTKRWVTFSVLGPGDTGTWPVTYADCAACGQRLAISGQVDCCVRLAPRQTHSAPPPSRETPAPATGTPPEAYAQPRPAAARAEGK